MNLSDLVRALLSFDALGARQWVTDSLRQGSRMGIRPPARRPRIRWASA